MSNIDKHAVQTVADLKAGYTLGHADVAILNELARIALASLEAEPVAWLLSGGGAKNNVSFDSGNAYADPLREVTPLYTATPAPVSVPAAMEMDDDFDSAFEHGKAVGWNACRADMLQGAENAESPTTMQIAPSLDSSQIIAESPSGNSPVIPEGWVACRERMPEGMTDVHISNGHDVGQGWWDGDTWQTQHDYYSVPGDVTHWMPMPAAPQQEVE